MAMSSQPNQPAQVSPRLGDLDAPAAGEELYGEAVLLSGWGGLPDRGFQPARVAAYLDESLLAETRSFFSREDPAGKPGAAFGFRMLGKIPSAISARREATLRVAVTWGDGSTQTLAVRPVQLVPAFLERRPYGKVVYSENDFLLHREHIYGSGPPLETPGVEAAELVSAYLPPGNSVVDVGCGAGAYGSPGLIAAGHDWLGLETSAACGEIVRRRQLPFRGMAPESRRLPGEEGEWDCAICLDVLEHVAEPGLLVSEIARVIRRRALFSVPNLEVLPYFDDWGVVPWHLLEADHKNFFTRASLHRLLIRKFRHVEIFSYDQHPLRTRDGVQLYLHLFAVADK